MWQKFIQVALKLSKPSTIALDSAGIANEHDLELKSLKQ